MIQNVATYFVYPMLSLALILGFVRLVKGPTLPDRIVAFDIIASASAGVIVTAAIVMDRPVLLDVASVWAIISFLGVIALAYYIEKWRGQP